MPRPEKTAQILRLGAEAGAFVDERPAVSWKVRWFWPIVISAVIAGVAGGLLWAWHNWRSTIKEPGIERLR